MIANSFVFNRQETGLKLNEFNKNTQLRKKFHVLATFKTEESKEREYIAIMEAFKLPIYIITYNIEMTQFVFVTASSKVEDPIDHSAASRKHA